MAAITDLATLAAADVADTDWLVVHDLSAATDKKIARSSLSDNMLGRVIRPTAVSIANNGTETVTGIDFGLIMVQNNTDGGQALIWLSVSSATIINQAGSSFTTTADTASKINVYISGGSAIIQNKLGSTKTFSYFAIGL